MIEGAVKHQNMSCVTRHILARKDKVGIIDPPEAELLMNS
jgi:hypothetical protein